MSTMTDSGGVSEEKQSEGTLLVYGDADVESIADSSITKGESITVS